METKLCSSCKIERNINDYGKDRGRTRGQCKPGNWLVHNIYVNSEKGKQTHQKCLETHKEQLAAHKKEYRETHKEIISERRKMKVTCECGSTVNKSHIREDERTLKPKSFMKYKETKLYTQIFIPKYIYIIIYTYTYLSFDNKQFL